MEETEIFHLRWIPVGFGVVAGRRFELAKRRKSRLVHSTPGTLGPLARKRHCRRG